MRVARPSGVAVGVLLFVVGGRARAAPIELADAGQPVQSSNGVAQLSWTGGEPPYQMELTPAGERSAILYEGRLASAHVSGLHDGRYTARVRGRDGEGFTPWSTPRAIVVEHLPLSLVIPLLAMGALTFAATAYVVVRAAREPA